MSNSLLRFYWYLATWILLPAMPALAAAPGLQLQGYLLDARTGAALPYASIGLAGHPAGTMTDLQGAFSLSLGEEHLDATLRFSVVGYQAREIKVRALLAQQASQGKLSIRLSVQPKSLAEVRVKPGNKRYRSQQVGSQIGKLTPFRHTFDTYTHAPDQVKGPELGVRIRSRKYPAYLERVHFCLSGTGADLTRVQLKLYSLRQNLPHAEILPQVIQLDVPPRYTGWIETDLSRYNLRLEEDFVVALEWLQEENETEKSWLASGMVFSPPQPDYYKPANQDKWKMLRNESVGLYVTLLY
ncbi:MAG: carboxypeptidase-like regulatory domain-containing protein [Adhaeribacter sp.]